MVAAEACNTQKVQDDCQLHAMGARIIAYIQSAQSPLDFHWNETVLDQLHKGSPAHPNETMVSFHNMASFVNIYPTRPQLLINWFDQQRCIQLTRTTQGETFLSALFNLVGHSLFYLIVFIDRTHFNTVQKHNIYI